MEEIDPDEFWFVCTKCLRPIIGRMAYLMEHDVVCGGPVFTVPGVVCEIVLDTFPDQTPAIYIPVKINKEEGDYNLATG